MTPNQAREAIYSKFIAGWTDSSLIILDNESLSASNVGPYVFLTVKHTAGGQLTLGGKGYRRFDRVGVILVKINTLSDTGTSKADELVQLTKNILEAERFDGVTTRNATVREIGSDGKWYSAIVEISFYYEETK